MKRLQCDMCHKPLKSKRFQVAVFMRPECTMTVGPDCYKKTIEAAAAMKERFTPEQLAAKRAQIAATAALSASFSNGQRTEGE